MNIDFEDVFPEYILERGYNYFVTDKIKDVAVKEETVTAKVTGTEEYDVKVILKNSSLKDAKCSCPYYETGRYCKHIAGVLYYLNNKTGKGDYSLKDIICRIDEDDLREFLYNSLTNDAHLLNEFRVKFMDFFPSLEAKDYEKKIMKAIRECGDRSGFIDYTRTSDYEHAMYEFIHEAEKLVDRKNFETAFNIVTIILDTIPDLPIDDSDGSTGMVADDCIEVLQAILDAVGTDRNTILEKILDYVMQEVATLNLYNYGVEIIPLIEYFLDNDLYTAEIEENLLLALRESKDKSFFYNRKNYIDYIIMIYINEGESDKIGDLLKEFSFDKDICLEYVDLLLKENEVQKAIDILKSRLDDKNYGNCDYAEKLSQIYYKNKMSTEYKEILYDLFYKYSRYNMDYYRKIKDLYSKDKWPSERDNIINTFKKLDSENDVLDEIFVEENMIDELYQNVLNRSMDYVKQYEKYLLPKYHNEVLDIYVESCIRKAEYTCNRSNYRKLAISVNHLIKTEDSDRAAKKLLRYLNDNYFCKRDLQ